MTQRVRPHGGKCPRRAIIFCYSISTTKQFGVPAGTARAA